jgi:hypothetical protein
MRLPARSLRPALAAATLALLVALTLTAAFAAPASATSPWWHISTSTRPASIPLGAEGTIVLRGSNLGNATTSGTITLSDVLPAGLTVQEEEVEGQTFPKIFFFSFKSGPQENFARMSFFGKPLGYCSQSGQRVSCQTTPTSPPFNEPPFTEAFALTPLNPYEYYELRIGVKNEGVAPGALNETEVSGGGGGSVSRKRPLETSSSPVSFGVDDFSMLPEEEGGDIDTQAGSHPYQLSAEFALNQSADPARPPALARNLKFNLPAGLIGNATLLPQCSDLDFRHVVSGGEENLCAPDTVVGVAIVTFDEPLHVGLGSFPVPIFNLVPERGEPARFGFEVAQAPVTLDASVRTGSDYGVSVSISNITQLTAFLSSTAVFWGVPGDKSHDSARGWGCLAEGHWASKSTCEPTAQSHPAPFLSMPSSCRLPFISSVEGVSWPPSAAPGSEGFPLQRTEYPLRDSFGRFLGLSGCDLLSFEPTIEVQPDVQSASTPTGLSVHVRVPQEVNHGAKGLTSSSIKDTTVTLPDGVSTDPSGADGLEACSESQIGFSQIDGEGTALFTPTLPNPFCATASKIGTVEFKLPVIENPVRGAIYLATQNQNPFGSLIALYIVAEDEQSGVLVKLAGEVKLSETGQITTTFRNSPQAPLEEATFSFFGGERAPLATPSHCGSYATQAIFTPWSEAKDASASSDFQITSGPNKGPCPNPLPFNPSLAAGTTNTQAGAFSPLSTTISREDGNQDIQSVNLNMPGGLSGILTGVPLCAEAAANAGTCSPASEIGKTIVSVGLGSDPFTVTGGQVFLTAAYKGAPFGLSIVNPAKAGPFDLGKVIVRAKVEVDPHTAALTVTTDPIPHILQGIPLQIKHVNVTIDRPGFTFNPTNCNSFAITGKIGSVEGANAAVQTPFQSTNCAVLKFAPKFAASTSAKTSKAKGASLHVALSYPKGPFGTFANIAKAKVSLPKQLPSRLTTLQKACTAATFDQDPAKCPKASEVGHAKVITPLIPVPLEGPAYFVSHGGEAFPDLTVVLKGSGAYPITIVLVGSTQIKNGVTTTTFKATPDAPFNSFELDFPQGPSSALAANANLCASKLTMPIELAAQNGAVFRQAAKIRVTGCKAHKLTRHQRLLKALKSCRKKHEKAKRKSCEHAARRRFGRKKG